MSKRMIQKKRTRQLLLDSAKKLSVSRGFLAISTAEIAKTAGVAHGTLFAHFPTRDELIIAILDNELDIVSDRLYRVIAAESDFRNTLSAYLDYIASEEDFFAVICRELPLYDGILRRKILFRQSTIQERFIEVLQNDIDNNGWTACTASAVVQMIFGAINNWLSMKTALAGNDSVVAKIKPLLMRITDELLHPASCGGVYPTPVPEMPIAIF
ncbi:MAG: TetR/AcrR family transcriptional regulator [Candidatus Cloacimonetes bacterium]|nr:TetR/AcrR family transcriptional regulator [Candidatus Cloacimonadota bacterium]